MLRKLMGLVGVGMLLVLAACGTSEKNSLGPSAQSQYPGAGGSASDLTGCPRELMNLMGNVTLTINDTPTGIAVDFVAKTADKVDAVRLAVRHMAEMHSGTTTGGMMGGGMGGMGGGMGGTGSGTGCGGHGSMDGDMDSMMGGSGCMGSIFANATVGAQDIDGGARLIFTATSADKIDTLRTAVRSHFESMATGQCPMM